MRRWVKGLLFTGLGIMAAGVIALFIAFAINGFSFRRTIFPIHASGNRTLRDVEENIDDDFSNLLELSLPTHLAILLMEPKNKHTMNFDHKQKKL